MRLMRLSEKNEEEKISKSQNLEENPSWSFVVRTVIPYVQLL